MLRDIEPGGIATYQIEATGTKISGNAVLVPRINGANMQQILRIFQGAGSARRSAGAGVRGHHDVAADGVHRRHGVRHLDARRRQRHHVDDVRRTTTTTTTTSTTTTTVPGATTTAPPPVRERRGHRAAAQPDLPVTALRWIATALFAVIVLTWTVRFLRSERDRRRHR